MRVDFYQLAGTPVERVLPQLAERVLAGGGRLLVVHGDEERLVALDRWLWTFTPESFLPHARSGRDDDAAQPVLLSGTPEPANGARNLLVADGRWRDEALGFERTFHLFDEEAVDAARAAWRGLANREGVERRYWRQDEAGRWEQAA